MMGFMRYLLRSKLAGIVFGLIIISMAVWGVGDIFSGNIGSDVVRAGKRGLTIDAFDRKFENYLNNVRDQTGESLTRIEAVDQGILDQLYALETQQMAKLGYMEKIGLVASDEAVKAEIESFEAFKNPQTQKFDQSTYLARLNNLRMDQGEFEQEIRDGLSLEYMRGAITSALQAPAPLARLRASYDGELRRLAWLVLTPESMPEIAAPDEADLRAFYDSRLEGFKEPERRAFSVLSISPADFIGQTTIEDADIKAVYEASKALRFSNPETRVFTQAIFNDEATARRSLGLLATGVDPATLENAIATEKIAALKGEIANTDLAEALFSFGQQPGAVFGPFEENGSWLVASLNEIIPGDPFPLETVSEIIRSELALNKAESVYYDSIADMDDLIGEGLDVATMGERLGVPVISYMPVDARGISANGAIIRNLIEKQEGFIAAQDYVAGEVSEVFDFGEGIYLIQLDRIVPESTPSFEQLRDRIEAVYLATKKSEGVQGLADELKARLESNESTLDEEAARIGVELTRPDRGLNRNSQDATVPPSILSAVFAANEGEVLTLPSSAGNQVMVIVVEAVEPPSEEALSVLAPLSMGELNAALGNDLLQLMEVEIDKAIDVKTSQASINAYKARITDTQ